MSAPAGPSLGNLLRELWRNMLWVPKKPRGDAPPEYHARYRPKQQALAIVAPITPGRRAALDEVLEKVGASPARNAYVSGVDLPTVHYWRFVIIPEVIVEADAGRGFQELLYFEANLDGDVDGLIDDLARLAPGIDTIFGCCEGWPGLADVEAYGRWMRAHREVAQCFHLGYRGVSKAQVENDLAVYAEAQALLEAWAPRRDALAALPALELQATIARALEQRCLARGLDVEPDPPAHRARRLAWATLTNAVPTIARFAWHAFRLHHAERVDQAEPADKVMDLRRLDALQQNEDRGGVVQNKLTHVAFIKEHERARREAALRFVLGAVDYLSRVLFDQGELAGIPTIHFARWVILDDKRVVFTSNYDGSWESYLGDFVDRAAIGLTGVWSHTEGFPDTRGILKGGATDEETFKRWARRRQVITQAWYSSYPNASIDNIRDAVMVRDGIRRTFTEVEARKWLRLL